MMTSTTTTSSFAISSPATHQSQQTNLSAAVISHHETNAQKIAGEHITIDFSRPSTSDWSDDDDWTPPPRMFFPSTPVQQQGQIEVSHDLMDDASRSSSGPTSGLQAQVKILEPIVIDFSAPTMSDWSDDDDWIAPPPMFAKMPASLVKETSSTVDADADTDATAETNDVSFVVDDAAADVDADGHHGIDTDVTDDEQDSEHDNDPRFVSLPARRKPDPLFSHRRHAASRVHDNRPIYLPRSSRNEDSEKWMDFWTDEVRRNPVSKAYMTTQVCDAIGVEEKHLIKIEREDTPTMCAGTPAASIRIQLPVFQVANVKLIHAVERSCEGELCGEDRKFILSLDSDGVLRQWQKRLQNTRRWISADMAAAGKNPVPVFNERLGWHYPEPILRINKSQDFDLCNALATAMSEDLIDVATADIDKDQIDEHSHNNSVTIEAIARAMSDDLLEATTSCSTDSLSGIDNSQISNVHIETDDQAGLAALPHVTLAAATTTVDSVIMPVLLSGCNTDAASSLDWTRNLNSVQPWLMSRRLKSSWSTLLRFADSLLDTGLSWHLPNLPG